VCPSRSISTTTEAEQTNKQTNKHDSGSNKQQTTTDLVGIPVPYLVATFAEGWSALFSSFDYAHFNGPGRSFLLSKTDRI